MENSTTHHRQETVFVNAPPMSGPVTAARPYVAPITPVKVALFLGSAAKAIIVYAPDPTPAAPTPAMARPTIRTGEFGATPQIKLPSSKMKMAIRKLIFSGKYLYTFPHIDWNPPSVMKKDEPYHEMSSMLLNSSVILGMAVATMVWIESQHQDMTTRELQVGSN